MASGAAASNKGEAPHDPDWLSCTRKKALKKRCNDVLDMLRGTNLQPMAEDLGFWVYRLENAFPADMHNRLVTLINQSFDPTKGVL